MQALTDAIYTKYNGSSALKAVLTQGLWLSEAPENQAFPYGVFFIVSDVPEYTFNEAMENILVQFTLFSNTQSAVASGGIDAIYTQLITLFDWCSLSVTGWTFIYMKRESSHSERIDDVWHYWVTYRILLWKTQ